jgi:hypothetical protein
MVDHPLMTITALDPTDRRSYEAQVAGDEPLPLQVLQKGVLAGTSPRDGPLLKPGSMRVIVATADWPRGAGRSNGRPSRGRHRRSDPCVSFSLLPWRPTSWRRLDVRPDEARRFDTMNMGPSKLDLFVPNQARCAEGVNGCAWAGPLTWAE